MKVLVLVDVLVLFAAVGTWLALRDASGDNPVNAGLRGSAPPAGQHWPELAGVDGIDPPVPTLADVRGNATMLVATCLDCRSGQVIGGFLGRLAAGDLPEDSRVVLVSWDGTPGPWRDRWHVPALVEQHHATSPAATAAVRSELGIGPVDGAEESGIAYLHDTRGRWRSTYFIGQLDRDDVAHDLGELGD